MANATNIVLADALATPVNHTFIPLGRDEKGIFWFVDQSASNEIGYWKISVDISKPGLARPGESSANRVTRVKIGLHEPILEVLSNNAAGYTPAPTIAYIPRCNTEYVLHERASLQNRKDLRKMSANLLNDANIVSVVESLQYLNS
ncbi:TPA_asm: coat protein [ssRNA phage SRR7976325_14]|uniref:Coat protein n=1 Tax=ssRNA phage SRR7976325_14 TaxID=2786701 RepID=A0A8S5L5I9_9VIRU|nr:coat protein [ssRNA phage SRR7976325_14]DAD52772.1 TPA_asm: coat protein [ssRNA phage SRR7976325_14]